VREAAKKGDREALERLVTRRVGEWVLAEGLYVDD
jgi:nicotinamide-nucleotide adenylyltransferase